MKAVQVFDGDGTFPRHDHAVLEDEVYEAIVVGESTFAKIRAYVRRGNDPGMYRKIDACLKRLKKQGKVYFHRGHQAWVPEAEPR